MRRYKKKAKDKKTSFSDIKNLISALEIVSPKVRGHQQYVWEMVSDIHESMDL